MDREQMVRLTKDATSISEKVRILHDAGVPKADIGRFVERRYQQIYNIILTHEQKRGGAPGPVADAGTELTVFAATLGKGRKVVLPAEWLDAEKLVEDDELVFRIEADGLKIMTRTAAQEALLEAARRRMPGEAALLESLLKSAGLKPKG